MKTDNKKWYFIFLLLTIANLNYAQKFRIGLQPSTDSIFCAALNDVIFIVKQEYGLKSTNLKNGKLYSPIKTNATDAVYGVGAIQMNKLYVESLLLKPWQNNKNYLKIKQDTLKPALGKTYSRKFSSISYESVVCSVVADSLITPDTSKYANKNLAYYQLDFSSIKNAPTGISVNRINNQNDSIGIVVFLFAPVNTDFNKSPDADIKMAIYNAEVSFDSKTHLAAIEDTQVKGTIIGGGFFIINAENGNISFELKGLLCFRDGKWAISELPPPLKLKQKKNPSSTDPIADPTQGPKMKNNQNNSNSTEPGKNK